MAVYTVGSNQDVVVAADDDTYDVTGSNNTFEVGTYNTLIFYENPNLTNTVNITLGATPSGANISGGLWVPSSTTVNLTGLTQSDVDNGWSMAYARSDIFTEQWGHGEVSGNSALTIVAHLPPPASADEVTLVNATPTGPIDGLLNITSTPTVTAYTGPVDYLTSEYMDFTSDNVRITATQQNIFLRSGSGIDSLTVTSGDNILDGSTASNILTGGTGDDTFYIDNRNPTTPVFSTIANFHSGDNATVWGVTKEDFSLTVLDNQGAAGHTGVDLIFSKPGQVDCSFVLAGYTSADLSNGRLTMIEGKTSDLPGLPGSLFVTVHAN